jgi:hypothetical protein
MGWQKDEIAFHKRHGFTLLDVEVTASAQDHAESRVAAALHADGPSP